MFELGSIYFQVVPWDQREHKQKGGRPDLIQEKIPTW